MRKGRLVDSWGPILNDCSINFTFGTTGLNLIYMYISRYSNASGHDSSYISKYVAMSQEYDDESTTQRREIFMTKTVTPVAQIRRTILGREMIDPTLCSANIS